jgi:hypothetical protein
VGMVSVATVLSFVVVGVIFLVRKRLS